MCKNRVKMTWIYLIATLKSQNRSHCCYWAKNIRKIDINTLFYFGPSKLFSNAKRPEYIAYIWVTKGVADLRLTNNIPRLINTSRLRFVSALLCLSFIESSLKMAETMLREVLTFWKEQSYKEEDDHIQMDKSIVRMWSIIFILGRI